jgi:ABC-type multidrug transport system ATPase subunit
VKNFARVTSLSRPRRTRTKRFGDRVAFDDVSFEVGYGEVFGFLGPNGAGKTTTVRTLGTLIAPSSGAAVNLEDRAHDLCGSLSKGLRQRVALARALLNDPAMLFS